MNSVYFWILTDNSYIFVASCDFIFSDSCFFVVNSFLSSLKDSVEKLDPHVGHRSCENRHIFSLYCLMERLTCNSDYFSFCISDVICYCSVYAFWYASLSRCMFRVDSSIFLLFSAILS